MQKKKNLGIEQKLVPTFFEKKITTQIYFVNKNDDFIILNSNYYIALFAQSLRQCDVAILIMIHALFAKKLNGNLLKKRTTPCEKMTCFKKFKEEFIQACHEIIILFIRIRKLPSGL